MPKLVKVKIKWPDDVPASVKFRYYKHLRMLAEDPNAKERFEWISTANYFPDYVHLTEEVAMLYILST